MGLIKYKLGELIEDVDLRNKDVNSKYKETDVKGISIDKIFIETKANLKNVSLSPYKLVQPHQFAYVTVTSRNGEKISLAYNQNEETYLVSSSYNVFKVNNTEALDQSFLFMYFNRPEFDRFSRFNSWGSARETFSWEDFCDIEINLPSIEIQKKYVAIYQAMLKNQEAYEEGLEDLKLACDGSVDRIKNIYKKENIFKFLNERRELNINNKHKLLTGVGNDGFITPRGSRKKETFNKCKIFYPNDFVYNPSVISKGAIAYNLIYTKPRICTEEYIVFYVNNTEKLDPLYLFLWLKREETGRLMDFLNIDSVRNRVYFKDLESILIPLPKIKIQNCIANIYSVYLERKEINEKLKEQIKSICPILIKGAMEEASREEE